MRRLILWDIDGTLLRAPGVGGAVLYRAVAAIAELAVKKGMTVDVSNSHSTFFTENKQAVRAEMRAAFTVYRPTAVCTVTGV